jgi:hypothetical protein
VCARARGAGEVADEPLPAGVTRTAVGGATTAPRAGRDAEHLAGEVLLPHARAMLAGAEHACKAMAALSGLLTGRLAL